MQRTAWSFVTPIIVLALAACGGEDAPPPPPAQPSAPPAAQTETVEPAEPVTAELDVQLPEGVTPQMVSQGRAIYHGPGVCFSCHGQDGSGGPLGPPLNDGEWLNLASGSLDEVRQVIRDGVQRPAEFPAPMPPMGGASLTDEQLQQVAAYVYTISYGN